MTVFSSSSTLKSFSNELVELVGKVAPSVVNISNQSGRGTGVIWSADGYVLTCSHVVGRSSTVTIGLSDGRTFEAKVVGQDQNYDVAALKADATGLKPVEPGDSENLKVGQLVVALANPYGRRPSATSGMITSMMGSRGRFEGMPRGNTIVTDALVNPGYSGGPLIDVQGKMIGMSSAYMQNRGLAIPVNTIRSVAELLISEGKITRAYLGISFNAIQLPTDISALEEVGQDAGIMVLSVERDSPAKRAGVALGDIILKIDDKRVTDTLDLQRLLTKEVIGKDIKLRILRAEKPLELVITPIEEKD